MAEKELYPNYQHVVPKPEWVRAWIIQQTVFAFSGMSSEDKSKFCDEINRCDFLHGYSMKKERL